MTSPSERPPSAPVSTPGLTVAPAVASHDSGLRNGKRGLIFGAIVTIVAATGVVAWLELGTKGPGEGFVKGNGRIEATEIDVAAKLGGRVQDIMVDEGDFVVASQTLGHMQVVTLDAERDEARARQQQLVANIASAEALVAVRASDRRVGLAVEDQRESEVDATRRRLARSQVLEGEGASSVQEVDDDRARLRSGLAAVVAARAQLDAAQAAIVAARAQAVGARFAMTAAEATIARINAEIDDSSLIAPRSGRVQYRIAQPGEVLGAGGKVLNLVDLSDVYMTFFLPESAAGKLTLGGEVRIVLDAAPQYVIPAKISFVASTAQFTPKTVETASERQKFMFRIKARIDRDLLKKHLMHVKTGLPGVAWIKLSAQARWPSELDVKVPE
jgi:HlyD family secretion protein